MAFARWNLYVQSWLLLLNFDVVVDVSSPLLCLANSHVETQRGARRRTLRGDEAGGLQRGWRGEVGERVPAKRKKGVFGGGGEEGNGEETSTQQKRLLTLPLPHPFLLPPSRSSLPSSTDALDGDWRDDLLPPLAGVPRVAPPLGVARLHVPHRLAHARRDPPRPDLHLALYHADVLGRVLRGGPGGRALHPTAGA
eukprot:3853852-Rhodomonas_salina.1